VAKVYTAPSKDTKLNGRQEWDFTIDLPSEVALTSGSLQHRRPLRLPETSTQASLFHSISYEGTLLIRRSRFKTDYR